ncbi:phosphohistidine phosphatase SixA [Pleionea litopenaei]|uniref:Phosphohistidine phosphatase SixA n=1 Tax=Pleionea litopenaei TaxID=3070815 RepID=A0AA51RV57_9GAMM|nr:phosphohistidine phosphatase SixA [Pleionea sp. HL-JVS1]WMS88064.1 phosphohistidine phosphatase SixA [Pleionea sp. HL-JVS1]
MRIWVIRHGDAEWEASSDRERNLTATGVQEVQSIAGKLDLPEQVAVWHSPYRRAKQSYEALSDKLGQHITRVVEEPLLQPDADVNLLVELLEAVDEPNVILVSHMPLVALLVRKLTQDQRIGGFQTAQVVEIKDDQEGQWQVEAVYAPSIK